MRHSVSRAPSSAAIGTPVAPSSKRYVPNTLGRFRAPFSGKTETTFTPTEPSRAFAPDQAGMRRSVACAPLPLDLVVMADRNDDIAAEGIGERVDERREIQRRVDLGSG